MAGFSKGALSAMARIFMEHSVEDYAKWRPVFDGDIARRDRIGLREIGVYRQANHPNEMLVVFEKDGSADEARRLFAQTMSDPELQARMKEGGVKAPPKAWIVE